MSHSHSHLRDPAIKLFGRNIPFPDSDSDSPAATHQSQDGSAEAAMEAKEDDDGASEKPCENELDGKGNSNGYRENEAGESNKGLKKPDKLIPCPRCNSSETKFCYFNNYNVNQPRHFCKNCHRYWTAGGTIRNVPVGAGRRRNCNKPNPTLQPRPDASTVVTSGVELPAGSDSPLFETMETKLNLDDPKKTRGSSESSLSSCSSLAGTLRDNNNNNCEDNNPNKSSECTNMVQCYPVPQWAYPWSPGWNFMMVGGGVNNSNPMMPVPGFCSPNVPFQFVPSSYWGYMPVSVPMGCSSPSSSTTNSGGCFGNSSPTLGKHSRDANEKTEQSAEEKSLWVPKTLRIDDPNEAAKSSIWSTLGIEADRNEGLVRSGIFKPFKEKSDTSNSVETDSDQVLLSNPAALSRSHSFQEST